MVASRSRRVLVKGATLAILPTAGCLFGSAHRGEADELSGQLSNDTTTTDTVTVQLTTAGGSTAFQQTFLVSPDETVEFRVDNPADTYTLLTDVESGPSKSVEWEVTPCSNYVQIAVTADGIDYGFTVC